MGDTTNGQRTLQVSTLSEPIQVEIGWFWAALRHPEVGGVATRREKLPRPLICYIDNSFWGLGNQHVDLFIRVVRVATAKWLFPSLRLLQDLLNNTASLSVLSIGELHIEQTFRGSLLSDSVYRRNCRRVLFG